MAWENVPGESYRVAGHARRRHRHFLGTGSGELHRPQERRREPTATAASTCTAEPPFPPEQLPPLPPPLPPLAILPLPLPMALVPQSGPSSAMSREGSRTALVVQNPAEQRDASTFSELSGALAPPAGTLRLRGGPRNGPRVAWDEAVVDNEGLGRKKSKSTYWRSRGKKK